LNSEDLQYGIMCSQLACLMSAYFQIKLINNYLSQESYMTEPKYRVGHKTTHFLLQ